MGTFGKIEEKIRSIGSSLKHSAKVLATAGFLMMNLSSCNDGKIHLDQEKQEVSFSIVYQGHRDGYQNFTSEVSIKKLSDSTFVVRISDPDFLFGEKPVSYEGNDLEELLKQVAEDINNRVPINTQEGHDLFVRKVSSKCDLAAKEFQKMINNN